MLNQQLIASIKADIKSGESLDSIKKFLIESNVDLDTINESISFIAREESSIIKENRESILKKSSNNNSTIKQNTNYDTLPEEKDYSVKLINNEDFRYESKKLISKRFNANDLIPGDHIGDHIKKEPTLKQIKENKSFIIIIFMVFFIATISITIIYFFV